MNSLLVSWKKGAEIFRPFRKKFAVVLALQAIVQVLTLLSPYFIGKLLNSIQIHRPLQDVFMLMGAAAAVSLLSVFVQNRKDIFELKFIDFSLEEHLTDKTLSKILSFSIGQHRSQNSGLTQSVVSKGQNAMENLMFLLLYQVLPLVAEVVITVVMLLWFSKTVGSIVLTGTVAYLWLSFRLNKKFWPKVKGLIDLSHSTNKAYTEILRNMPLVQVNSQESRIHGEQVQRVGTYVTEGQNVWIPYNIRALAKTGVTLLNRYSVLAICALLIYNGKMLFGDFVILWYWTQQATGRLWEIGRLERQWLIFWGDVRKYLAILDVVPTVRVVENPIELPTLEGRVEFRNVSFTYPEESYIEMDEATPVVERKKPLAALQDVSFTIEPGMRVAFVGESGAGKSTIVNLLVRGHDPDKGQILVDGHDLRLLDLRRYRQMVGLVEQNVVLFDNTLEYNVLFGLNGQAKYVTEHDLEKISAESRIDRFNHRLVDGWKTRIGENGLKLSGGERQRVGIARALIKNSRILILDEATSNLDQKNERMIKEAIHNASLGRTTIIIAHRLSTVRDADRIYVMDKGSIVGVGRHEELCDTSRHYRELVQDQLVAL